MTQNLLVIALVATGYLCAQRRVDPRNTYHRIVCVVPFVGAGTPADPKRPMYSPWPATHDPNGIIAFYYQASDDGRSAVVEFVARNRSAFQAIFSDKTIKVFEKGVSPRSDIEAALQQVRKDFNLDKFGMVMP